MVDWIIRLFQSLLWFGGFTFGANVSTNMYQYGPLAFSFWCHWLIDWSITWLIDWLVVDWIIDYYSSCLPWFVGLTPRGNIPGLPTCIDIAPGAFSITSLIFMGNDGLVLCTLPCSINNKPSSFVCHPYKLMPPMAPLVELHRTWRANTIKCYAYKYYQSHYILWSIQDCKHFYRKLIHSSNKLHYAP